MPIYDYKCQECGHEFEEFARISDPPITQCPVCGRPDSVCRLISGTFGNIERNGREYFKEVIEPEAKRIAERIKQGDEDAMADVLGEGKMG
jgi:putative FmdB family regulatory protein